MRVRLLEALVGPGRGPGVGPGELWECSKEEAQRLIERGMAEPVGGSAKVENAMRPASQAREVRTKGQPSDGPAS